MFKKLVAVCATMVFATIAQADERDWSGWYAGGYVGYLSGELNSSDPSHAQTTGDYDDDGPVAGIFGGYRRQLANDWVVGAEIYLPLYMDEGTAVDTTYFPGLVTYEADPQASIIVSAHVGRAFGRTLPYAYASVGLVSIDGRTHNVDLNENYSPGFVQSAEATHVLWEVGVGVDQMVTDDMFIGGRVGAFVVEDEDHTMPWNEPGPNEFGFDAVFAQVRIGYRF